MTRKILLFSLLILGALQFIRPERPVFNSIGEIPVEQVIQVPPEIHLILKKACYDCHSNNTRYPWYSHIMPLGWWIQHHVNEGRESLNFSRFGGYQHEDLPSILNEIQSEVRDGVMPLQSYLWGHPEAHLSAEEIKALVDWARNENVALKSIRQ